MHIDFFFFTRRSTDQHATHNSSGVRPHRTPKDLSLLLLACVLVGPGSEAVTRACWLPWLPRPPTHLPSPPPPKPPKGRRENTAPHAIWVWLQGAPALPDCPTRRPTVFVRSAAHGPRAAPANPYHLAFSCGLSAKGYGCYGAKHRRSLQKPALCSDCLRSLTGTICATHTLPPVKTRGQSEQRSGIGRDLQ